MRLRTQLLAGLELADPFMIGASHWTAREEPLRLLSQFQPSAVTLKTTSAQLGGKGNGVLRNRLKRNVEDSLGNQFATFVDGPKTQELIDVPTTAHLLQVARELLPHAKIGLSILSGEKYEEIARALRRQHYDYAELNLKYEFRGIRLEQLPEQIRALAGDLNAFFLTFPGCPVLVKLPRELTALIDVTDLSGLFEVIVEAGAGVILANSRRIVVPPSRTPGTEMRELTGGVIVGEHLFLDTYNGVRSLASQMTERGHPLSIAASGGVLDVGAAIDLFAAGASAVQLCSILDVRGPHCIAILRQQLEHLGKGHDVLSGYLRALRDDAHEWKASAAKARDLRIDVVKATSNVFSEQGPGMAFVREAILAECKGVQRPAAVQSVTRPVPGGLRFVFTKGNVSSYVLAQQCVGACECVPLEYATSTGFCRALREPSFSWDVGILPESAIAALARECASDLGGRGPRKVLPVANSVVELVGVHSVPLSGIQRVYHFGGISARSALEALLKEHDIRTEDVAAPGLIPLLRCWADSDGILAKPPLSRLYGLMCTKGVAEQWGVLWSQKEPLWLVASESFWARQEAELVCAEIGAQLGAHREEMLRLPDRAAKRARSEGFLEYLARLLQGRGEE